MRATSASYTRQLSGKKGPSPAPTGNQYRSTAAVPVVPSSADRSRPHVATARVSQGAPVVGIASRLRSVGQVDHALDRSRPVRGPRANAEWATRPGNALATSTPSQIVQIVRPVRRNPPRPDDLDITDTTNTQRARLRALWTVWSVGVRVSLGALASIRVSPPRRTRSRSARRQKEVRPRAGRGKLPALIEEQQPTIRAAASELLVQSGGRASVAPTVSHVSSGIARSTRSRVPASTRSCASAMWRAAGQAGP
jgi:hypothetical protein